MAKDLNPETKKEIILRIIEEVNNKDSARVGYHAEQVLGIGQFKVPPNILSKIEAKIIQNRRYLSRPYSKSLGDYEIYKNPTSKKEELLHEVKKGIITGVITLLVGVFLWLLSNQSERRKNVLLEKRIENVENKLNELQNK